MTVVENALALPACKGTPSARVTERSVDRVFESDLDPVLDLRSGSKHLALSDRSCRFAVARAHEGATSEVLRASPGVSTRDARSPIARHARSATRRCSRFRSRRGTPNTAPKPCLRGPSLGPLGPCRRRRPFFPDWAMAAPFRTRAFGSRFYVEPRTAPVGGAPRVVRRAPGRNAEDMVPTRGGFTPQHAGNGVEAPAYEWATIRARMRTAATAARRGDRELVETCPRVLLCCRNR